MKPRTISSFALASIKKEFGVKEVPLINVEPDHIIANFVYTPMKFTSRVNGIRW